MKIENGKGIEQTTVESPFEKAKVTTSFQETIKTKTDKLEKSVRMGQTGYGKEELTKGVIEEFEEKMSNQMDATERKNQMAVMANTMSAEDYRQAEEDGFSVGDMASHTVITAMDKIKVQLAKAGVDVSVFGDSLTQEQLESLGGNAAAAAQLQKCLEGANLPATEANLTEGVEAYAQAQELKPLSEGAIKYLLDNRLEPSIENLYMAEFSGSASYMPPQDSEIDFEAFTAQLEQVITAAGEEVNEQTLSDSKWMVESEIPLTAENFSYMQKLSNLALPMEGNNVISAIVTAVSEGNRPNDAMLLPEYSITAQAEHAVEIVTEATEEDIAYLVANNIEISVESLEQTITQRKNGILDLTKADDLITAGNKSAEETNPVTDAGENNGALEAITDQGLAFLRAKRVLEETRLAMTTEANRALIKQGISIDTKPLEALVEDLKQQESSYYTALLQENGEVEDAGAAALFEETSQKVSDLKEMPAYLLGMHGYDLDTVNGLHEAGTALKDTFEKAGESYETLMTAPRKDLGDSIQKAFANLDDILKDIGLESSEANRRAVRILAYNQLEITEESITTMKAADERVQRTFSNLTPAAVRELIRQGNNPLDMPLEELNATVESIQEETGAEDTKRFSEYLWKLEQNHEISQDERESYIGIYRLIRQVEKTDGAAIGALISQGGELTMRNLLTAVRSAKKSGMDYTIDDEFAGADKGSMAAKSITEQIDTAYQNNCIKDVAKTLTPVTMQRLLENSDWENYTPEQLKEALMEYAKETQEADLALEHDYAKSQLKEAEEAATADDEVYHLLEHFEIPNTINNVIAANRLLNKRNQVFSQLFNSDEVFSGEEVDFAAIEQDILEKFSEALKTPEEMAAAQEALAETAENVMKTMIADEKHITSMDIRELKLMNTQLSIAGKMADEEEYNIPVLVGDEVTNLSLKIVRGTKRHGMVEIMFEMENAGKVAASIAAKEEGITGLIAADDQDTEDLLSKNADKIAESLGENCALKCTYAEDLDFSQFKKEIIKDEKDSQNSEYAVQTVRLYKIAKSFIESVKELQF